jgi:hypothetical protein
LEKDGPIKRKVTSSPLAFLQNVYQRSVMGKKSHQIPAIMRKLGPKTEEPILLSRRNNEVGSPQGDLMLSEESLIYREKLAKR